MARPKPRQIIEDMSLRDAVKLRDKLIRLAAKFGSDDQRDRDLQRLQKHILWLTKENPQ